VSRWIQLLHKHPAHLHAIDIKDARKQRDPGIKPLEGMTTSKLADKYIVKRNKIPAKTQKTENSNLHGYEVHRPSSRVLNYFYKK